MLKGKLNVVIGLQWGSEAKGKLVQRLCYEHDVNAATCNFAPNAGHSIMVNGEKKIFKQLPVAACKDDVQLFINPGAAIDVDRLLMEIDEHCAADRLVIHPHAAVVTEDARMLEAESLKYISSTRQGGGAANALKSMRDVKARLAVDEPRLKRWVGDTTRPLSLLLRAKAIVLAEAAQGFDLSLNHGLGYPYVTGRDVTTASVLSDAGIPPQLLGDVYGCLRTYPIRVGHQYETIKGPCMPPVAEGGLEKVGDSGPFYPDQRELSWDELKELSGSDVDLTELTTVTKKIRRVFTFSVEQFAKAMNTCASTHIFVNFINHINAKDAGKTHYSELSDRSKNWLNQFRVMVADWSKVMGIESDVSHVGTGPGYGDMITLEDSYVRGS